VIYSWLLSDQCSLIDIKAYPISIVKCELFAKKLTNITELTISLKLFQATVRLQASSRSPITTAKTAIYAENSSQATQLLTRQFGERSVLFNAARLTL